MNGFIRAANCNLSRSIIVNWQTCSQDDCFLCLKQNSDLLDPLLCCLKWNFSHVLQMFLFYVMFIMICCQKRFTHLICITAVTTVSTGRCSRVTRQLYFFSYLLVCKCPSLTAALYNVLEAHHLIIPCLIIFSRNGYEHNVPNCRPTKHLKSRMLRAGEPRSKCETTDKTEPRINLVWTILTKTWYCFYVRPITHTVMLSSQGAVPCIIYLNSGNFIKEQ